ncbi:alpha/beta hydrolase family protein [Psychroflexus aestuariivivens]|uniref:alpha/beta hydrolase family protein n=1 Tax=Psychroflexus aestuariivivens TaxID=1795040 RepID=UPI000FD93920|nr:alpha/beta fold hydrolase [Psychroflexus aestuariivivens]
MKKIFLTYLVAISGLATFGQNITGDWNGVLDVQGMKMRLVFHIENTEEGLASIMDSPDQNVSGIPVTSTEFKNDTLTLKVKNAGIEYIGVLNDTGDVEGNFSQNGMVFKMNLTKNKIQKSELKRPQEPEEPFPYHSETVKFKNKNAKIKLAGTLTLPNQTEKFPAVVLISGSGPQDRNESILGHKPFLVLSDYLTRQGIAVLRYDDRGFAESEGDFGSATTLDFAKDAEAAVEFLKSHKNIDSENIGIIGHSEGGLIAPIVARDNSAVAFIVLMAGTGIPGDELLYLQQKLIGEVSGLSEIQIENSVENNKQAYKILSNSENITKAKSKLKSFYQKALKENPDPQKPSNMTDEEYIDLVVSQIATPWFQTFINTNPADILQKVNCPVLAINGEKDLQVPPKENLQAIEKSLKTGGNQNITTIEYPNLNHLFQESKTGAPSEYAKIEQTIAPYVLEDISEWILIQVK